MSKRLGLNGGNDRHVLVFGETRSGKSVVLAQLIAQARQSGGLPSKGPGAQ